jgi:hypothetical protein
MEELFQAIGEYNIHIGRVRGKKKKDFNEELVPSSGEKEVRG